LGPSTGRALSVGDRTGFSEQLDDYWVELICTEISADDQSFGVENHDVVTTWESK
jgi:hypothetical protein